MLKKILNLIFLNFKGYSLLRSYQIIECRSICLRGKSIEFGAYKNKKKILAPFLRAILFLNIQIFSIIMKKIILKQIFQRKLK